MYWSNHAEERILRLLLGQSISAPSVIHAGALLANPGDVGNISEISYPAYARQAISFSEPAVSSAGSASITNTNEVQFPESNIAAGTVTYIGFFDSTTGGNMWAYVVLDEPIEVAAGVAPLLTAGSVQFTSSGNLSALYRMRTLNLLRGINMTGFNPYVALFNGDPDNGGAELAGENYARFPVVFGAPTEQASGQMMIVNSEATSGPRSGDTWGTWTHTVIFDEQSGGNPALFAARTSPLTMLRSMNASIRPGAMSFSLT